MTVDHSLSTHLESDIPTDHDTTKIRALGSLLQIKSHVEGVQ